MTERALESRSSGCSQWEMLLTEALDEMLLPGEEQALQAHRAVCPACAALYAEAVKGRAWLEYLAPEPEMPAGLLERLLAQTGPGATAGYGLIAAGQAVPMRPAQMAVWPQPGFMGSVRRYAEPRLLMTAAMAFFSIALTLNMTGVRLSELRLPDLRPGVLRSIAERRLAMASTPILRYYDHSRLVDEVSVRVKQLRRAAEEERLRSKQTAPAAPGESQQVPNNVPQDDFKQPRSADRWSEPETNESQILERYRNQAEQPAHSGNVAIEERKRSTRWIA